MKILLSICLGVFLLTTVLVPVYTPSASAANLPVTDSLLPVQATAAGQPIYKYLVHPNTGGPVACGDSLYPVYVGKRTGDTRKDVATALKSLFASPKNSGGLFNPLADSRFKVQKVEYNKSTKNVKIFLGGKLVRPDSFCDIARARAMVWTTAQQFPEVRHATIVLGSALLGDLLAAKERAKP